MQLQHSFGVLSEVIASFESDGGSVRSVETASEPNGGLRASLDVPVEHCGGAESDGPAPASASVTPDGGLRVEYSPAALARLTPPADDAVTTTRREASVTDEGDLVLSIGLRIEPRDDGGSLQDVPNGQDSGSDRSKSPSIAGRTGETSGGAGETGDEDAGAASDGGAGAGSDDSAGVASDDDLTATRDGERSEERDASDPIAAARDTSVPPFEDVDYLRGLYERCDTFAEMSRRIEMDVSAETVRRYMTDAGVHQPERYEGGDAEAETANRAEGEDRRTEAGEADEGDEADSRAIEAAEANEGDQRGTEPVLANDDGAGAGPASGGSATDGARAARTGAPVTADMEAATDGTAELPPDEHLVTDGLGLPADLDLRDVVDAVVDARCLYDVTRSLGLDQERTRDLLVQLNLLDLVSHRLSTVQETETSFEDVAARIRQCSPEAT